MTLTFRDRLINFLIKLRSWEYWPFYVVYFPVFFYWTWLVIKTRSLFFFFSSNPGIENGGWLGESKWDIYRKINEKWKPKTALLAANSSPDVVTREMEKLGISFPVILKPDIGERGWGVEKIESYSALTNYLKVNKVNFLLQEFIDYPWEAGIFYFKYPGKPTGTVSSIVVKEFLKVKGDGKATIEELILTNPRARLQLKAMRSKYGTGLIKVLEENEEQLLMPIGNHCRGTTFLNGNNYINQTLQNVFDEVSETIEGFYFGRFDIRFRNLEDLYTGDFKILELNGAGAEPGHIYHPGSSIFKAYQAIFFHLNVLYEISERNHLRGFTYPSFLKGWAAIKKYRQYNKLKSS